MAQDKETRENLIDSAKAEFMEKGYSKASLRSICAKAGVTTGALYFFFEDKADLYRAILGKPVDELFAIMQEHFDKESDTIASPGYNAADDHNEFAQKIIHHIYSNYDAVILLLTKSQGSEYENIVDKVVDFNESKSVEIMERFSEYKGKKKKINTYMHHFVIHLMVDAFVHLVTHEPDEEKARAYIKKIIKMMMGDWMDTFFD